MAATIGLSHAIAQTRWINEVFQGMIVQNPLSQLTSNKGGYGVIQMDTPDERTGTTYNYHFIGEVKDTSWRVGDERASGQGQSLNPTIDTVTLDRQRVAVTLENYTLSQQRAVIDLLEWNKQKIIRAGVKRIGKLMMTSLAQVSTATINGRTQNRYLYGGNEAKWNATHTTALANVAATDKMSLDMIDKAIYKAKVQGTGSASLLPADVRMKDGTIVQKYVMLLDPVAAVHLRQDPRFQNYVIYNVAFDMLTGSRFIGEYMGVLIYEFSLGDPQLTVLQEAGVGASSTAVCHNLLLGASAGVLSFGKAIAAPGTANLLYNSQIAGAPSNRIFTTMETQDHGGNVELALTMVLGTKKLVDSSSGTAEDFSVVHVFSTGVL